MKAALLRQVNEVEIADLEMPQIGPGQILVKVYACGLCSTDVSKIRGKEAGTRIVLGHEVAGEVAQVGTEVSRFSVGDRVVVAHHAPCFICHYCRHGNYSMCPDFKSSNIYPGGFAEFIQVPRENVNKATVKIPPEVSYEEAALTEPAACCLRGVKLSHLLPGDWAVVVGTGTMGLLLTQMLCLFNVNVIALDLDDSRLAVALESGARWALNPQRDDVAQEIKKFSDGRGADVAILTVVNQPILDLVLGYLRDGGKINLFAWPAKDVNMSVDFYQVFRRELSIFGSYSTTSIELQETLDLMKMRKITPGKLITHNLPLNRLMEGVRLAEEGKALKILIKP